MTAGVLILAVVALVAGLFAVSRRNIVYAALDLLVVMVALAALFFLLGAPFVGAVQLLIYVGAVLVVFLIGVVTLDFSDRALAAETARLRQGGWRALAVPALLAAAILAVLGVSDTSDRYGQVPPKTVGLLLYGEWVLAVELVSLLLLVALIVARAAGRRDGPAS